MTDKVQEIVKKAQEAVRNGELTGYNKDTSSYQYSEYESVTYKLSDSESVTISVSRKKESK